MLVLIVFIGGGGVAVAMVGLLLFLLLGRKDEPRND